MTADREGAAIAEYVAAVLTVGLLMLALIALREHRPQRRPPVDPVAHLHALVRAPVVPRVRVAAPAAPARPRRRAVRKPPPPRATVLVPGWAVGW
ncbi:MAG: hypothetical protein AB7V62_07790 [Thermoleophilia bacterium]